MILEQNRQAIETNISNQAKTFTIEANAEMFHMLSSGLYTNKIKAVVRELSTNAVDAMIAKGTIQDKQFEVHLPTALEPFFGVRDFGVGLTEKEVYENCLKVADNAKGLIIADFSSRNIERLETFKDISSSIDRSLIITCKDAYLLKALESVDGINRLKNVLIYEELKKKRDWWEEKLIESISNNIDQVSPEEISRNQDNYLLCFSLYDLKNLLDINPKNGTYIYSSSEAFEEESELAKKEILYQKTYERERIKEKIKGLKFKRNCYEKKLLCYQQYKK